MALTPRQMAVIRARARAKKAKPAAEMQRPTALGGLGYQPEEEASRQAFRQGAANVAVPSAGPQQPKAPTRLSAAAGQFAQSATLGQAPNILAAPYALTGQFPEAKAFYQQRLMQGAEKFPVTTGAADIAGFFAPGGAVLKGVTTLARPVTRAVQTAPAIVRGGAKVVGGAGLGATEGALYGATVQAERQAMEQGQAAPTMQQRGEAAVPAAAMGAVVGGALPIAGKFLEPAKTTIAGQVVKAFGPGATARQAERVAQKAVRADLQRAGINNLNDFLKAAEQYQGKPVMTAELTQSMTNSLTALTRAKGTTGDKVKAILENRVQGFPERMMRDLQEATGLDPAAIVENLDELMKARQAVAAPQYKKAFAEPFIMTPTLEALMKESPEAASALARVQRNLKTELAGTGKTFEDVPKLDVYDRVKRILDERVRKLIKEGETSQASAISNFTERLRNELDIIVPEKYEAARLVGGEAPSLREANKAGIKAYSLPFDMFKKEFAKVKGANAEAFKGAFVREISNIIDKNPARASAILAPEFQSKLRLMFGKEAADRLTANVRNEIAMRTAGARFNPNVGPVTSQALMGAPSQQSDEMLAAGEATLEFAQNLLGGRWASAVGPVLNYFRRAGYTEAQLNAIGDLLASDPQRAARILFPNEMARLGATPGGAAATNVLANPTQPPSGGRNTLAMPPEVGGAFVGGALGATQGETPEERARNALLGAAGGAVGGRMARGMTPDKTRMGSNLGNVLAPSSPQGPKPNRMGFYSQLEATVMRPNTPGKATGEAWAAWLKSQPGVKAEELEATGVTDWLRAKEGQVSRADVENYVRNNGVQVEEVTSKQRAPKMLALGQARLDAADEVTRLRGLLNKIEEADAATGVRAKYQEAKAFPNRYGPIENVIPDAELRSLLEQETTLRRDSGRALMRFNQAHNEWLQASYNEGGSRYDDMTLPGGENYTELLLKLPVRQTSVPRSISELTPNQKRDFLLFNDKNAEVQDIPDNQLDKVIDEIDLTQADFEDFLQRGMKIRPEESYRSGHWDEPNVLAHVRFKERTGPNGERILALEEVQSDWHQTGRERGYGKTQKTRSFEVVLFPGHANPMPIGYGATKEEALNAARSAGWSDDYLNTAETREIIRETENVRGVPDAPFKDNKWAALAMKRVVKYAADNGFDGVAWIPGNIQNGKFHNATDKRADFYDKIFVNIANEIGKKSGAKVGRMPFKTMPISKPTPVSEITGTTDFHYLPLTPELRKKAVEQGFPLFSVGAVGAGAAMTSQNKAEAQVGNPRRPDGTLKGKGWLGELPVTFPNGSTGVATEYSMQSDAVKVDGRNIDFPTLVPSLTPDEVNLMLTDIIPNRKPIPEAIVQKAIAHARAQLAKGQSVFVENGPPDQKKPPGQRPRG